jgi:hypothetical protein
MQRKLLWRSLFILFLLGWAAWELYPPTSRNLIRVFEASAVHKDARFAAILSGAENLEKRFPQRTYGDLLQAVGTNDLQPYFPFYQVSGAENPTRTILNRLQQEATGKIKLGLDLRGGTMFLVRMSTNRLAGQAMATAQEHKNALSQAIDVLRHNIRPGGLEQQMRRSSPDF